MYSLFAFPMLHVSLSHPPLASFIIKPKSLGFPRRKGAPVTRSFELPSFLQLSQLWSILLKSVRGLLLCFGGSLCRWGERENSFGSLCREFALSGSLYKAADNSCTVNKRGLPARRG